MEPARSCQHHHTRLADTGENNWQLTFDNFDAASGEALGTLALGVPGEGTEGVGGRFSVRSRLRERVDDGDALRASRTDNENELHVLAHSVSVVVY